MRNKHRYLRFFYFLMLGVVLSSSSGSIKVEKKVIPDLADFKPLHWQSEVDQNSATQNTTQKFSEENQELAPYYEEFAELEEIKIYIGWGKDAWEPNRFGSFLNVLINTMNFQRLNIVNFRLDQQNMRVNFTSRWNNKKYLIQGGYDREGYISALKDFDAVIYHGHSRYGRGPAFESYQNYFRLGKNHDMIEVSANNRYFIFENILNQDQYPPKVGYSANNPNEEIYFQYRGGLVESSELSPDSFTVQIEANAKDFNNAEFKDGKQMFFFYSCKNRKYWENPFRERFPDKADKIVFGTKKDSYWLSNSSVVFILGLVKQIPSSKAMVAEMEQSRDNCVPDCYTSY